MIRDEFFGQMYSVRDRLALDAQRPLARRVRGPRWAGAAARGARRVGLGRRAARYQVAHVAQPRLHADRLLEPLHLLHQLPVVFEHLLDLFMKNKYTYGELTYPHVCSEL